MHRQLAVLFLVALLEACCCRKLKSDPLPPIEELIDRGRSLPLGNKDFDQYARVWREILARAEEPDHRVEALYCLAMAHQRLGRMTESERLLQQAVEIESEHHVRTLALYPLAARRYERGDVRGGIAALEEFQSRPPTNRYWNAAAGYLIGKWLVELDESERAKEALRNFLAANPREDHFNDTSIRSARGLLKHLEKD